MQKTFHAAWLLAAATTVAASGAVFAPTEGYFGIQLPYVPPPSALDLRVDGDALAPLLGRIGTNDAFVTLPLDPKLGQAADHFRDGNLVLAALAMENLRRGTPPAIWSRMPLGDVYYEIGWYTQAVEFCEQVLAFNPDLEAARRVHVAALVACGQSERAVTAARKYAGLRRNEPVAHYLLACAHYAAGNMDPALDAVNASLLLDDRRTEAWRLKAQLLLAAKRPREAIEAALRCRRVQGGDTQLTLLLARAFAALNDPRQAEALFREAAQGNPPPREALLALARFLEHTQPGEAIATMERAADAHPNAADVRGYLARLYAAALRGADAARERSAAAYLEGRIDDALEAALDAIDGDPGRPVNYVNASTLLQHRGELKAAASMAEQAAAKFPQDATCVIRLAQVKAADGDRPGAVRVLEGAAPGVRAQPAVQFELARLLASEGGIRRALEIAEPMLASATSPEPFRLVGNWRLAAGRVRDARDAFAHGLKIAPQNTDLINGYVYAAMSGGTPAGDLLPLARKAAELAPGDAEIADTLGWVLAECGKTEEAVHVMEGVLRKLPDHPSAGYHYALACARHGRPEPAAKKLREILAAGKPFPEEAAARALLERINAAGK